MLVYGGVSFNFNALRNQTDQEFLYDLWELWCVKDGSETNIPSFQWIPFHFNEDAAVRLQFPQATSAFEKSIFMLSGWKIDGNWNLRSFDITNETWGLKEHGQRQISPGKLFYMTGQTVAATDSFHVLIACCKPLWVLDLLSEKWYQPKQLSEGKIPLLLADTAAITDVGKSLLAFGGKIDFLDPSTSLWKLTILSPDIFYWTALESECPNLRNIKFSVGGIINKSKLVLLGGFVYKRHQALATVNDTWTLNLKTLVWSKQVVTTAPPDRAFSAGAILQGSTLIIFGGLSLDFSRRSMVDRSRLRADTWGYDIYKRNWINFLTENNPGERMLHNAFTVNDESMIVLGGQSTPNISFSGAVLAPRRDVWVFTPNVKSGKAQGTWRLLHKSGPPTYFAHSAAVLQDKIVIYGGTHSSVLFPWETVVKASFRNIVHTASFSLSLVCEDAMWATTWSTTYGKC